MPNVNYDEIVNVPVPRKHLHAVYQALARAMAEEGTTPAELPASPKTSPDQLPIDWGGKDRQLLAALRQQLTAAAAVAMLDLAAERPVSWITFREVVEHSGRTEGQARADLGTLTKLIRKIASPDHRVFNPPVALQYGEGGGLEYQMSADVAEVWNSFTKSQADEIREFVIENFVKPARAKDDQTISLRAGDIHKSMGLSNRMPAVCSAVRSQKFAEQAKVTLVATEGAYAGSSAAWTFSLD